MPHQLPLLTHMELVTCGNSRTFQRIPNPNPNQGLKHATTVKPWMAIKTLLNIGPLGEGVPFLWYYLIVP